MTQEKEPAVKAEQAKIIKLPATVLGMDVSADASQLYAACMDGGVYQVDVKSGEFQQLYRHESFASGVSVVPDTSLIISAGYDGALIWYEPAQKKQLRNVPAHQFWSWQSDVSSDGKYFASVTGQYLAGGI